jgi:hypothetical protein
MQDISEQGMEENIWTYEHEAEENCRIMSCIIYTLHHVLLEG